MQRPRRNHERHHRHRRRQQRRHRNRSKSVLLKRLRHHFRVSRRKPRVQRLIPLLPRNPVRNISADHRTDRCHHRVVHPPGLLVRRQHNRHRVHAARNRNHRAVQQPQQNQSRPAQRNEPVPHRVPFGVLLRRLCQFLEINFHRALTGFLRPSNRRLLPTHPLKPSTFPRHSWFPFYAAAFPPQARKPFTSQEKPLSTSWSPLPASPAQIVTPCDSLPLGLCRKNSKPSLLFPVFCRPSRRPPLAALSLIPHLTSQGLTPSLCRCFGDLEANVQLTR